MFIFLVSLLYTNIESDILLLWFHAIGWIGQIDLSQIDEVHTIRQFRTIFYKKNVLNIVYISQIIENNMNNWGNMPTIFIYDLLYVVSSSSSTYIDIYKKRRKLIYVCICVGIQNVNVTAKTGSHSYNNF